MFDAAMEAAKDIQNSVVLFNFLIEDLQRTVRVPVVICIDQYNAFLVDHEAVLEYNKAPTTISWGSNPIGRIFSDWNNFNVQRGAVLFAFTSSYHGGKTAIDGNSRLFTRISPYNNDEWAKMTNRFTDSLPPDTGFLRNFVGGIPRELGRFMKIWDKERHNGVDNVMKLYTKDATDYLLDKKRMKEDVKESTVFAAKIFMGSPMDDVPDSWENSGMAIFKAFDDSHTKNAISILRGDKTISWQVLELCVQHRFRMAAMSANIVEMEYMDLTQKKEKEKIQISAQNIIIHNDIPVELPTIHPGTVYICWRDAAVVDFFIYNHDCKKIFLQVSEQPYAKHKTKLPDLFTTTITRHNLSVYDFFSKCIDETYDPSDRNSLDENDYYVYLTTSDILLSQDQVLSLIPPNLEYSNELSSSRATTKGEFTAPSDLILWREFFDEVALCSFGQQQKYQEPNFREFDMVANEESVRMAMDHNIFHVLNGVMKDEEIVFTNQCLGNTVGVPDFIGKKGDQLILTIEVKKECILPLGDRTFPDYYAVDSTARTVISQAYTYMASNRLRYGVLTTYHQHWFLRRQEGSKILSISKTLNLQSDNPMVLKAYAYLAKQAKEQHFCEHPDVMIGSPNENSQSEPPQRYPFRPRKNNSNSAPQERTEPQGSGNFQSGNFVGEYLGYGRSGTTF
ncbi:8428_t:CDS:2, partial [Paraglomus brasilianum]